MNTMAPSTVLSDELNFRAGLPSSRMLVDSQYAMEQLNRFEETLQAAQAGAPLGEPEQISMARIGAQGPTGLLQFAHIRLTGLMISQDSWYGPGVNRVVDAINEAFADSSISGILLEVNTGGGEVTAGQMMAAALRDRPKPVVTLGHLVASGGIMATLYSDEIIASGPFASFGSIGVMRTVPTWYYRLYSNYFKELYSDRSPNKNKAHREYANDGTMNAWMQELNALAEAFQNEVKESRPLKGDTDLTLSGAMFRGREAIDRGLADSMGGYQYAITRLATLARRNQLQR